MSAVIIFLLLFNFAVSWFNAWSVGRSWNETKAVGGVARFMAWCGAIMSASGFTWSYLVLLVLANMVMPHKWQLPPKYVDAMFSAGYLIIILPVIGSGIAITVQSWSYFWRERNFKNGAVAGYNTFADVYNIYEAAHAIPESFSMIKNAFKGGDDEDDDVRGRLALIAIALAVLAVVGGCLTTAAIIRSTARKTAQSQKFRANSATHEQRQYA